MVSAWQSGVLAVSEDSDVSERLVRALLVKTVGKNAEVLGPSPY